MIDQIRNDRIAQGLLTATVLAGLAACGVFIYVGYLFISRPTNPALTLQQRLEQRGFVFGQPTPNPEQPGVTIFPCTTPHGASCAIHLDSAGNLVQMGTTLNEDKAASAGSVAAMVEVSGHTWPGMREWVEGAVGAGGEHIEVQNGYEFRIVSTPVLFHSKPASGNEFQNWLRWMVQCDTSSRIATN